MTDTQKFWAVKLLEKMLEEADPSTHMQTLLTAGTLLQTLREGKNEEPPTAEQLKKAADQLLAADTTEKMLPSAGQFVEFVLNDAAENGDAAAANDLGAYFYEGRGNEQDYAKAAHYYEMAAELGNMQAVENLGYIYYYGRIGEPDYEKAFFYFIKSALAGQLRSLYKIGDMYRYGYFVKQDARQAFCVYEQCMRLLNDTVMADVGADILMRFGDCQWESIGTAQNPQFALTLYQEAERLYTDRLKQGDRTARGGYEKCIERQEIVRRAVQATLPERVWP